jgi:hypothetical protein
MDLRLRDGERMKFAGPRGGTNPITARTVPPDDVIGEIINSNQAFIPIAVGPFGGFGSLFCRFIDDVNTLLLPTFPTNRPNAARAAKFATNYRTFYNVFGKAGEKWKAMNPSKCFDGSYLSQFPSTWANQKLGLATSTHLANHVDNSEFDDDDCWRFFDGLMEGQHALGGRRIRTTSQVPETLRFLDLHCTARSLRTYYVDSS